MLGFRRETWHKWKELRLDGDDDSDEDEDSDEDDDDEDGEEEDDEQEGGGEREIYDGSSAGFGDAE